MTSLEADQLGAATAPGVLPSDRASLLEVENRNVVLVTWKMAEDGSGTILRLEEVAGKSAGTRINSKYFRIAQAWRCSGLEDNQSEIATTSGGVEVSLRPFEIVTIRMTTQPQVVRSSDSADHSAYEDGK